MRNTKALEPLDVDDHVEKVSVVSSSVPTSGWSARGHIHAKVTRHASSPVTTDLSDSIDTDNTWPAQEVASVSHQPGSAWRIHTPALRRSVLGLYAPMSRSQLSKYMIPGAILAVLCGGVPISMTYVLGRAFSALGQYVPEPDASSSLLDKMRNDALGLLGLAIAALVLRSLDTYAWLLLGENGAQAWRKWMLSAIVEKEVSWFELGMGLESGTGAAGLMALYASDTDDVRLAMGIHVGGILRHISTVLVATGFALSRHWALTLVIYATLPAVIFIMVVGDRMAAPLEAATRCRARELSTLAEKCMSGIRTIKACTWEAGQLASLATCARQYRRVHMRWTAVLGTRLGLGSALSLLTFVQGFGYGSWLVQHGRADAAVVLSTFLACLVAMSQLQTILQRAVALERGIGAAKRLTRLRASHVISPTTVSSALVSSFCSAYETDSMPSVRGSMLVKNVWMTYPTRPQVPVLCRVDMTFPAGEHTYVIGASGSGKSTVAALLARLYDPLAGNVSLDDFDVRTWPLGMFREHVLCVRQEPLILERSMRENLDPKSCMPQAMLDAVCSAMRLNDLVNTLPAGLDTVLGTRGIELSGGQKQRIALARALLINPTVLILDEVTSALDRAAAVAVHAVIRAWRQGLTTVFITHDLSLIGAGDRVYVMADGRVKEQGTLGTLRCAMADATAAVQHYDVSPPAYPGLETDPVSPVTSTDPVGAGQGTMNGVSHQVTETATATTTVMSLTRRASQILNFDAQMAALCTGATSVGQPPSIACALLWLWRTIPSRTALCAGVLVCVMSGATVPAFSLCLTQILMAIAHTSPVSISAMIGTTACVAVADGVLKGARHAGMDMLAIAWVERLRVHAAHALLAQDCAFYDDACHAPSTLTNTVVKEADDARLFVSELLGQGAVVMAMGLGTLVWAMVRGWQLTLCACALLLVGLGVLSVHGAWLARCEQMAMHARTCSAERVFDYASNQRAARAMALDTPMYQDAIAAGNRAYVAGMRTARAVACGAGIADALMYSAEAVLYAVGAVLLVHRTYDLQRVLDVLSPLVFTMSYAASAAAVMPAAGQCMPALGQIHKLSDLRTDTASDKQGHRDVPDLSGRLEFEHVSFAYGMHGNAPLHDVSFTIEPGEKVALVGRSGCGKSTVLALAQRLYEPAHGHVVLNEQGVTAADVDSQQLRRHLAVVSQHATLFAGTIKENVLAGSADITDAELVRAACAACVHEFIAGLPEQYATRLGTIATFSGGQMQRIEWARAFARKRAKIWLLDEPTSALDQATRDHVLSNLSQLTGTTAMIVTHDVQVMQRCDRILLLDEGRIVASGPWHALCMQPTLQHVLLESDP